MNEKTKATAAARWLGRRGGRATARVMTKAARTARARKGGIARALKAGQQLRGGKPAKP